MNGCYIILISDKEFMSINFFFIEKINKLT